MDVNEFPAALGIFSSGEEKIKTHNITNQAKRKRKMASYHTRAVSFPSTSHSLIHQFNEHLCSLKSSESTSSSSSLTSISNRLSGLENLYSCFDDVLLQAPRYQYNLANEKRVEEALDGYLSLLDVSASTKEIFSQTKEDVQQLLSSIRRNKDSSIFPVYIASRNKTVKCIRKLLKDLKSISNKNLALESDQDDSTSMLKEAQEVTVSVLESLLSNIAGTKAHSKSLISKLLQQKNGTKEVTSEFEQIDVAINSLKNTETLQNQLKKSELSIQNVEEVLKRLIRHLIKTRVSLLNILNH